MIMNTKRKGCDLFHSIATKGHCHPYRVMKSMSNPFLLIAIAMKHKILKKTQTNSFILCISMMVIIALTALPACETDESMPGENPEKDFGECVEATVYSMDIPEQIHAGQPAVFTLGFIKPTPCNEFIGFQTNWSGSHLHLSVCLEDYAGPCIMVIDYGEEAFTTTFDIPGMYTLHFLGTSGPDSLQIHVQ